MLAGLPSPHPSLHILDWGQGPSFADGPLLTPHPFPPQRTARGWPQFSACQRIRSKGNVKHSRHCVLELGKLSAPQFTLLSETPSLTTEQSPRGPGPRHCSPSRAAHPRGDPPLSLQPQTPCQHSLWLLTSSLLTSSCLFPSSRVGRRPEEHTSPGRGTGTKGGEVQAFFRDRENQKAPLFPSSLCEALAYEGLVQEVMGSGEGVDVR